jgi:hypothetical protein
MDTLLSNGAEIARLPLSLLFGKPGRVIKPLPSIERSGPFVSHVRQEKEKQYQLSGAPRAF